MYPSIEEVIRLSADRKIKRIPLCREVFSDRYTPVEMIRVLRGVSNRVFVLESADQNENRGRYTFLGFDPCLEVVCRNGEVTVSKVAGKDKETVESVHEGHPGNVMRNLLEEYRSPDIEGMPPFTGGFVGYFSYDYIRYAEPKLNLSDCTDDDPSDMDMMLFDKVIVFDNYRQKLYLIAGIDVGSIEEVDGIRTEADIKRVYHDATLEIEAMCEIVKSDKKFEFEPLSLVTDLKPEMTAEEYGRCVEKAKHYIREGDIFQVVLSNAIRATAKGSLFDTYRVLRSTNPSPYMFYIGGEDIEIAGASPETLVSLKHGLVNTFPLAGTRPRGTTPQEDKSLEEELLADEKERAEHNMLVDLGRNDIGKISEIGSVEVARYMDIVRFSHVMHIGSTVNGKIRADRDCMDAVDAILPAGTLSGAPKIRACEIIDELEASRRGLYGGAVGYVDLTGNLDICIAIRLAFMKKGNLCIRSGAGIVSDSVPEREAEECLNKAGAVINAVKMAEGDIDK